MTNNNNHKQRFFFFHKSQSSSLLLCLFVRLTKWTKKKFCLLRQTATACVEFTLQKKKYFFFFSLCFQNEISIDPSFFSDDFFLCDYDPKRCHNYQKRRKKVDKNSFLFYRMCTRTRICLRTAQFIFFFRFFLLYGIRLFLSRVLTWCAFSL